MDTEIILIIIMAAALFFWVIFCVCFMFHRISKAVSRSGVKAHIQCEKCGSTFDVSPKEAMHISMTKTKGTTKTKIQGGGFVNRTVYKSYAKKFYCSRCGKKTFGQVLNLQEIQDSFKDTRFKEIRRTFIMIIVGGLAILLVMQIPMHFADKAKDEKIEQMKQQQYEDIKASYWH